jgi:hypothetical protein
MVQNKLALGRFVHALAWSTLMLVGLIWLGILIDRFFHVRPPRYLIWIWGGLGASVLAALVYALIRRPSRHDAAVAIDEKLALKEKFSTALFARALDDPFAQAAVKDAERTAENVSLHKRFPLQFPRQSLATVAFVIVALCSLKLPAMDLFGRQAAQAKAAEARRQDESAKNELEKALEVIVAAQAKGVTEDETIKQAKLDLEKMLHSPIRDPDKAKRTAARALTDVDQAIKQQIASNQKLADAENDAKAFRSIQPPSEEKGPVADAQRKIAKGDFAEAVDELDKAVKKFDQMDEKEKEKAAQQMQQMANQLQQMANDPKIQQQIQQQMQQAGMNQQQAQQVQQLMQQAAQGNQQAARQLQQMAQQAMKQMNGGQGPNQQQQQQIQQMMKQMQAQVNAQQQAAQMQQAAQQMAQAMKQQAQGGQQGQGQNAQAMNQNMAQGMQNMQQQLNAMQAMKADAQQVAAAQAAAAQAAADAAAGLNGQGQQAGQQQGQNGNWNGQGQFGNNQNNKWNGPPNQGRGGGVAAGDRTFKELAPGGFKQEISPSQDDEKGKILASTLIKAQSEMFKSLLCASAFAPPPEHEATYEIEQERISRPAHVAVKNYFSAWQKGAEKGGAIAPAAPAPAEAK